MERRGEDISAAVERMLSANRPAVAVTGPAGAGKTAAVLEVYRRYLDDVGRPGALLLAPNGPTARRLRRRLIDASPAKVAIAPAAMTFAAFAERVLAAADEPAKPISPFRRHLLLGRVIRELNDAGELAAVAAVADTPGLVTAMDRTIAELKRAAVEPADLATAVGDARDKRSDVAAIYAAYQRALHAAQAYDVEGQMWLAREHLARAAESGSDLPGLAGVRAVLADGFTDFTPTQAAMLALLCERVHRVVVTLPYDEADTRKRMWHWTRRTRDRLRHALGAKLEEVALPAAGDDGPAAASRTVFDLDARAEPPEGLSVVSAASAEAEVAAAARKAKRLLVEGAAPGSVAVLARSLEPYRDAISRVFAAHDVGVAATPAPLIDVPIVRFLLSVAALPPDYAWNDTLRVIRSSYFRPAALGDYDERTVAAAEMILRDGDVLGGRDAYRQAASRLAERALRDAARREEDDPDAPPATAGPPPELLGDAADLLGALFDVADDAARPGGLADAMDTLDLDAAAAGHGEPELIARDLRALTALRRALAELPTPPPGLRELREALSAVECPPGRGEALVDVLDVLDARALRYDHVILLGLGEGQFPPKFVEPALIGEDDRRRWRGRNVELDSREDLTAREMLLFHLAVSRARRTLTVTYPDPDAVGGEGGAGSFLLSLVEPFGGLERVGVRRIAPGEVLPASPEDIATPADALNAGLAALFQTGFGDFPGALAWAAEHRRPALRLAVRGLLARDRRWQPGGGEAFDGRITDSALRERLACRYPGEEIFSAGRLNAYARCPWQYFARYVLRLEPPSEPERRLQPQSRGVFCHNVLFRLTTALAGGRGGTVRLADVPEDELIAALDAALDAEDNRPDRPRPPYPELWRIQRERIRDELLDYLRETVACDDLAAESRHFELAFGQPLDDADVHDPASTARTVPVDTPAGTLAVRGRIDRIDRVRFEDVEGLLVVDYKTGRLPAARDIRDAVDIQLPLYAEAVGWLLNEPCVGGAFHRIGGSSTTRQRYFAAVARSRGRTKVNGAYADELAAAREQIGAYVAAMAEGRFDLLARHDCPSYCPYRQICHYSPARMELLAGGGEEGT